MRVRTVWTWGVPIVALLVVTACALDSNPTAVSSLPPNVDQKDEVTEGLALHAGPQVDEPPPNVDQKDEVTEGNEAPESTPAVEFSCTNVEMVRARFSQPGYVEHNKVGLYVFFWGIPEGEKRLRIWWDYMGRRDVSRDVRIESGEESFENVLEHVYEGLTEPTTFVVRVQVIVDGLRGQCARNREVDVRPPPSGVQTSGVQTPGVQTAFVGPVDNTIGDSRISSSVSFGLKFTVFRTMTLRSVRVYPRGTGTLVVQISDTDGNPIGSSSAAITIPGDQRVSVGMTLPPGDYEISLTGTSLSPLGLYWNSSEVAFAFPYTVPGVVSINSATGDVLNEYNYFYNWEVSWQ